MPDRFQLIKQSLSAEAVAKHYGFNKNKRGLIRCIFHPDQEPSMIIDDRFYCLGCGAKGDAVDFVAKLFGLSLSDAADKIINDFKLDRNAGKPKAKGLKQKHSSDYPALEKWVFNLLCEYLHMLESWEIAYAPEKPEDYLNPRFIEAVTNSDRIEYLLVILLYGTFSERFQVVLETLDKEPFYMKRLNERRNANERKTKH